ncbi:MAG: four helix bundle protein [Verrucomicrobia bacterium]|nr:four helix bundle protein [Verrucomicrobiota bacterium]
MSEFRTFEELECWKAGRELRVWASVKAKTFPKEERFVLCSQLNRAARSITANIAEGYGRFHYQENIQFCRQSRGSAYEVLDHLITACDEGYIREEILAEGRDLIETAVKLINGYVRYLEKQKSK